MEAIAKVDPKSQPFIAKRVLLRRIRKASNCIAGREDEAIKSIAVLIADHNGPDHSDRNRKFEGGFGRRK